MVLHTSQSWYWIAFSILGALFLKSRLRARSLRLPPGPTPLPIIGHLLNVPRKDLGREFAELSETYGDVVHLHVLGHSMVTLGSYNTACDLLDKRSANYSDRPESVMVSLAGLSWLFIVMNYGSQWRQHRRAFHQQMNSEVVGRYEPIQLDGTRALLRNILESPRNLATHLKFAFATIVMRISYGIELQEPNDKYFQMVERVTMVGEEIMVPGRFLVEAMPWLRYLPVWFPGAGFKRYAAGAKREILDTVNELFRTAKAAMEDGPVKDSFVSRLLETASCDTEEAEVHEVCKAVPATTYIAGADTSNASMRAFFLAMALYPDAQRKAQAEIDAVVGASRLPDFGDRHSLPYVSALVKELLRWHIVAPIGVPHRVVSDDEYKGYLIPAGATIVANIWGISRDSEVYPDPDGFHPERFLDDHGCLDVEGKDPSNIVFGFGRRICPGRHFAESTLFIICASLLWAFSIGPPVDEEGNPIQVKREITTDAIVSHASVPEYTIKPRLLQAKRLIDEV